MAKQGKFIGENLMNQQLELFIRLDSEWLAYQDGDAQSYTILLATPKEYDEESGILTMEGISGNTFYLAEGCIDMFWVAGSGFKLGNNSTSTIRPQRGQKKRDIM